VQKITLPSSPVVTVVPAGAAKPSAFERVCAALGLKPRRKPSAARNTVAFTIAIISLSAKMAKADGVAARIEKEAFDRLYRSDPADMANVRKLFELAAMDVAGFETYARQISALLADDQELKRDVFEGLFHIAVADDILHEAEETYLKVVAATFGMSSTDYRTVKARFVVDANDPYTVLGLTPDVGTAALKAQFKRLVKDNHPDLAMARGVPKDFVELATRKLASINAAYDQIARERGI
jgi:DnaJ like chaperone protein